MKWPYTDAREPGRLDVNGVEWWACDPYPTWYRWDDGVLRTGHAEWADEVKRLGPEPEPGDRAECQCGDEIVWKLRPVIPFPEVATEEQRARSGTGRWVHDSYSGSDRENEWCAPRRAVPKKGTLREPGYAHG